MKVLIVDDEPVARRRLARMVEGIPGFDVVGLAADTDEALAKIAALRPDVILLDIRMPGEDGMSFATRHGDLPPVIFTTAYAEHAVEAFEACAVDYLVKPVQQARLEQALRRAMAGRPRAPAPPTHARHRVTAREGGTVHVFDARAIARFYASDKYACFHRDGREFLLDESLSSLERRLAALDFLRVHRAELINLNQVRALRSVGEGAIVELSDGQEARVSRRHLPALRRAIRAE